MKRSKSVKLVAMGTGLLLVAACEEDEATRLSLDGKVDFSHDSAEQLLDEVECDVVAIGDYYARRGPLALAALERGRHCIVDKPLCTRLEEVERLGQLATERGLKVGCMLTMRDASSSIESRRLIRQGAIGEIHAITFGGQHPLLLGSRPAWYFEAGKHGGTINDIGIHAFDSIPWITGLRFARVEAARCWNAFVPQYPHFNDGAQALLTMDNGAGVSGDVSYFAPDGAGYALPQYWRMTFWGRDGLLEYASGSKHLSLARSGDKEPQSLALGQGDPGGYFNAFLRDIAGKSQEGDLDTPAVLQAARTSLQVQQAADRGQTGVAL